MRAKSQVVVAQLWGDWEGDWKKVRVQTAPRMMISGELDVGLHVKPWCVRRVNEYRVGDLQAKVLGVGSTTICPRKV